MDKSVTEIAARFVDLAQKYGYGWSKVTALPDDEKQTLNDVIEAAGFGPSKVVLGKLEGEWRDEDGPTGRKYGINTLCPYKVGETGDDYGATGWLDEILRRIVHGRSFGSRENPDELIKVIEREIIRSNPLKPVQLTTEGDLLKEYPPTNYSSYLLDHTTDDKELGCCVGVHAYCYGWMDRHGATETHSAIVCRKCHLRVLFPHTVKTYGELRNTLNAQLAKAAG